MAEKRQFSTDEILYKCLIAFGQGTDYLRIGTHASNYFAHTIKAVIEDQEMAPSWERDAVQFLERMRMVGRVAAARAVEKARTFINKEDVRIAVNRVGLVSKTTYCPGQNQTGAGGGGGSEGGGGG